jgi:transcriptional regulator with XRE-family HTH domain
MGFKENLKSELTYSGMLVKELAAKSGVAKYSLDNYLNKRGQLPSIEAGVKIAQALGVTAEYLVGRKPPKNESNAISKLVDQLDDKDRQLVLSLITRLKTRH